MNTQKSNALTGTKTEKNLHDAAGKEALSHIKYKFFSGIAQKEENPIVSALFKKLSDKEYEHAELWLSYLEELDDTPSNLDSAIRGEIFENEVYYPDLAAVAAEEGFLEISEKFSNAAIAELNHAKKLKALAKALSENSLYTSDAQTVWVCCNCGYSTMGNKPPERCPLCGHSAKYFEKSNG